MHTRTISCYRQGHSMRDPKQATCTVAAGLVQYESIARFPNRTNLSEPLESSESLKSTQAPEN